MELKRDEIVKALECCTYGGDFNKSQVEVCSPCPYFHEGNCTDVLKENALSLINELTEQIDDLTETVTVRGKVIEQLQILTTEIEENNRKLTEENEAISERYAIQVVTAIELDKQVQRLTEENERLRGFCYSQSKEIEYLKYNQEDYLEPLIKHDEWLD